METAEKVLRSGSIGVPRSLPVVKAQGIIGTGSALPERILSNIELASFLQTSDEWIQQRVGIRTRHIAAPSETTVSLAVQAAERAMENAGITPAEIDLLILATVTPDTTLPSGAALVQSRLGISSAMAFDVQAACTGFLFGLGIAHGLQHTIEYRNALVIGAETLSRIVNWKDRDTCVLFGDGAGAVVYRGTNALDRSRRSDPIKGIQLQTCGELNDLICRPAAPYPPATFPEVLALSENASASPYVQMKGSEVFRVAVNAMCESITSVLEQAGCTIDDVALFVPHQSNRRMVDAVCERLKFSDPSRIFLNIDRVGNTSAASIPIALDEAVQAGMVDRGDLVLMTAVGAGITYGSVLLEWQ